jgi:hypothetical protein
MIDYDPIIYFFIINFNLLYVVQREHRGLEHFFHEAETFRKL